MEKMIFNFTPTPSIYFGSGNFTKLPGILAGYGKRILLVTGGSSLEKNGHLRQLEELCQNRSITNFLVHVSGEPTPETVDTAVRDFRSHTVDAVCAIGGGSVIDAGKAISAMMTVDDPVEDFLEGVGSKKHPGTKLPFIAVPTTAGTGSEATKNAVIRRVGARGFKKSLRHDNFMPDIALIDPDLCAGLPLHLTVSTGLDAFSQLVESFISTKGNVMTASLALEALKCAFEALPQLARGEKAAHLREKMSYAALISGITLANAGLAAVHGIAGALGGVVPVAHGSACGMLLYPCMRRTFEHLTASEESFGIDKFSLLGKTLCGAHANNPDENGRAFIEMLAQWDASMKPGRLSQFGVQRKDLELIVIHSDSKNNPVQFNKKEILEILEEVM